MSSVTDIIHGLRIERADLMHQIHKIDDELMNIVIDYKGSVPDALRDGIVKLNFPAPYKYKKWLDGSGL